MMLPGGGCIFGPGSAPQNVTINFVTNNNQPPQQQQRTEEEELHQFLMEGNVAEPWDGSIE